MGKFYKLGHATISESPWGSVEIPDNAIAITILHTYKLVGEIHFEVGWLEPIEEKKPPAKWKVDPDLIRTPGKSGE